MSTTKALHFLQRLIQTPSLPGQEEEIAGLVLGEMQELGYDEAWIDEAGNVVGLIRGRGEAPAMMFNTHLDHVDPGDPAAWPVYGQPHSGALYGGKIWGRGACDIKGPLAAQVYGAAALLRNGKRSAGDVYVSAVVQEEIGGLGARWLSKTFVDRVGLVIVGEPSSNELRRGHRGRSELVVRFKGRSVHASNPALGINPHFMLATFLHKLPSLEMATHEELGRSSVAPTVLRTDQTSTNVTPSEVLLTLDWRHVPGETTGDAKAKLEPLVMASLLEGGQGEVFVPATDQTSYTQYSLPMACDMPAYSLAAAHPAVRAAEEILEQLGRSPKTGFWRFATDGGNFSAVGMTVIGFGPGDETLAHTVNEHIDHAEWEEAIWINEQLAREWPQAVAKGATGTK